MIIDVVRLNCFYIFYKICLDKIGNKCFICVFCFFKKIFSFCEVFNESIIKLIFRFIILEIIYLGSEWDDEINDNI